MAKQQDTNTVIVSPPALRTTPEAAAYLKLKPSTLEQHRWKGCGPSYVRIGRSIRYRQADLDAFLDARVFSSTTEADASLVRH
jgi:hypothetical protein